MQSLIRYLHSTFACRFFFKIFPNYDHNLNNIYLEFQDENWGETTTAVTNNSDIEYAMEDLAKWQITSERSLASRCWQHLGPITSGLLAIAAFLSPILMVVLPQMGAFDSKSRRLELECDVTCDGMLISFAFKLLILLIGSWGVFFRQPKATLPRIFVFRAIVSLLVLIFIVSFWLFYGVHLLEDSSKIRYADIVQFALSLIDALLFVHYLAILLIELRHLTPVYYVKVVRSPDGQSASYSLGQLSIQRAAAQILEKYYCDFPVYNPYLEMLPGSRGKKGYKVYEVDGVGSGAINVSITNLAMRSTNIWRKLSLDWFWPRSNEIKPQVFARCYKL